MQRHPWLEKYPGMDQRHCEHSEQDAEYYDNYDATSFVDSYVKEVEQLRANLARCQASIKEFCRRVKYSKHMAYLELRGFREADKYVTHLVYSTGYVPSWTYVGMYSECGFVSRLQSYDASMIQLLGHMERLADPHRWLHAELWSGDGQRLIHSLESTLDQTPVHNGSSIWPPVPQ